MSGEGAIISGTLDPVAFDRRPGALEATRGLDLPPLVAVGRREDDGWKVVLLSVVATYSLTPAQARALAIDLADYAGRNGVHPVIPRAISGARP